mmetsp:Transcript_16654/g.25375  ORF Transcript_16654/g.25375 Transcript_16654/m.25375 type:complete len:379 (-) Transcript_16654:399-1535(-)
MAGVAVDRNRDASDKAFRSSYQSRSFTENNAKNQKKFLGMIDTRYLRTFTGLVHALASIVALFLGNYLFVQIIIMGKEPIVDQQNSRSYLYDTTTTLFHIGALLSGLTLLPFWNNVQSWQLSTTTMEDKGLVSKQMQNFNRGRGVLAPVLSAAYPLLFRFPSSFLQNALYSRMVGGTFALVALYQFILIRDYGPALFIVYGGSKLGFSLHVLWSGSLWAMHEKYPYAMEYLEKEAVLVTCCVEFGFLWYYLYSRRLVTKRWVQLMCKNYHPALLYIWVARIALSDHWWRYLPWSLFWVMTLNTLLTVLFLTKLIKSFLFSQHPSNDNNSNAATQQDESTRSSSSTSTRLKKRRSSSSIFEVTNSRTGRRSSVFESITK